MALDLSSLKKGIAALEYAVGEADNEEFMARLTRPQQELIRAGVIQHFEFTYELCWKFIRRWLAENVGRVYVDGIARRELFRLAAEHRLIDDVEAWWEYHRARNLTSHIYDEDVAEEVFATAVQFLPQAQEFLATLEIRNIDLHPDQLAVVQRLLAEHLPGIEARLFGSRVTGTARPYSDLDLVIMSEKKIDRPNLYRLEEAFIASDLPFRVDVLDWSRLSDSFRQVIEQAYVVVQGEGG